jgi:hypothetical protein
METIGFYAFSAIVVAIPAGLIYFAARLAHRACKSRRWPKIIALSFALAYLLLTLVPFAIYGPNWAAAWFYLALPFSLVFEITAPMGFGVFVALASTMGACFLGTVLYVVFAIVLRLRRRKGDSTSG